MASVLFVCLGNICRSPLAEGVMRHMALTQGLDLVIDSAGTGGWHKGSAPDPRAVAAAKRAGMDISGLRARQVAASDFQKFTHILAMDRDNFRDLQRLAPQDSAAAVHLLRDGDDVPDPYYGDAAGFDMCLDLITPAVALWFKRISDSGL